MANIHILALILAITPSGYFYTMQIMHQVQSSLVFSVTKMNCNRLY